MDYISLQTNPYFDFFGLFSYFKLSFQQDLKLIQIIQSVDEGEQQIQIKLSDPEYTYNQKNFCIFNYGKGFDLNNIVKYSLIETKQKIEMCKKFGIKFKDPYFYVIGLRALIFQPISFEQNLTQMSRRIYPWIAFEVFLKKKHFVLYFNFNDHIYCEIDDIEQVKTKHFVQLEKVTYGFQIDEILVTSNNKCIVYRARYQEQRNYIAEVFRFAIARDLEIKVLSHYINPNDPQFRTKMTEQENNLKLVQQSYFKLIRNDRVIPPSPLLTYKGRILKDYHQSISQNQLNYYISIGQNHIVQHKYSLFLSTIPYVSEYFYLEDMQQQTCLGLHIGKQLNYVYFQNAIEKENFKTIILNRRKQIISVDAIFIHFQEDSLEKLTQFKRIKLKDINIQIEQQEKNLEYLKQIKNDLEMDVIEGELNSAVKEQSNIFFVQSQSIINENSGLDSPSFLQQQE